MNCVVREVSVVVFEGGALFRVALLPVMVDIVVMVVVIVARCVVGRMGCLPFCSAACIAVALMGQGVLIPAVQRSLIAEKWLQIR